MKHHILIDDLNQFLGFTKILTEPKPGECYVMWLTSKTGKYEPKELIHKTIFIFKIKDILPITRQLECAHGGYLGLDGEAIDLENLALSITIAPRSLVIAQQRMALYIEENIKSGRPPEDIFNLGIGTRMLSAFLYDADTENEKFRCFSLDQDLKTYPTSPGSIFKIFRDRTYILYDQQAVTKDNYKGCFPDMSGEVVRGERKIPVPGCYRYGEITPIIDTMLFR